LSYFVTINAKKIRRGGAMFFSIILILVISIIAIIAFFDFLRKKKNDQLSDVQLSKNKGYVMLERSRR
jgi:hypothetical protein